MNYLIVVIYSVLSFIFFNYFFRKYNFLIDRKILPHKSLTSTTNTPVIGGLIIIFYLIIFNHDLKFIYFYSLIFLLGFFSDLMVLKKPLTKFILQLIIVLSFLFFYDLKILSTKILFLDYFLDNKIFSILFTLFCLLISFSQERTQARQQFLLPLRHIQYRSDLCIRGERLSRVFLPRQ